MLKKCNEQVYNTVKKIESITNKDVFKMGFITDVHTGGNNHVLHLKYFSQQFDKLKYNVAVNGGDIGLDLGENLEQANKMIEETATNMSQEIPFLFCKGNHDFGSANVPNVEIVEKLCGPSQKAHGDSVFLITDEDGGGYGYYDDKVHKVKVVFLNTSEGNTRKFIVSDKQIEWLISTLSSLTDNYKVIITAHFCIDKCGEWKSYPLSRENECFKVIKNILQDFANKQSGSYDNKTFWDFSKLNKNVKLVCYLCGDSHFNNFEKVNGVNYVVRQGYGGVDKEEMPNNSSHDKFSYNDGIECDTCQFDTLLIDGNTCYVIRTGIGQDIRDLQFDF